MKRQPDIYKAEAIKNWETDMEIAKGIWIPARPMGHNAFSFTRRWKLAWKVLIGECDALVWSKPLSEHKWWNKLADNLEKGDG
jgi:hypothetical protein